MCVAFQNAELVSTEMGVLMFKTSQLKKEKFGFVRGVIIF